MAAASRQFDLTPAQSESWVEDGKLGMENALRTKPEDVREHYEWQLKDLQEAYGEACWRFVREKGWHFCGERTRAGALGPLGP